MGVCDLPIVSTGCSAVGSVISGVAGDVVSAVASHTQQAEVDILGTMMSFWAPIPTPVPSASTGAVGFLRVHTSWLVGFLAVLGLLIAAGRLAWERRGEPARQAATGLLNLVVVSGASVTFITLASQSGDAYSNWILGQALGGDSFNTRATSLVSLGTTSITAMLMIVLGLFGIISCIIQIVLMLARTAMLGLLAGVLPLGAAISGTQEGRAWFRKMCAWLLAFELYKPVAATVYAYAFVALKDNANSIDQISGLVMIILASVALPALMRFVTPMVSGTTGGGGGAGAALAGAAVATGARMIASRGKTSGGGGGGGGGSDWGSKGNTPSGSRNAAGGDRGGSDGPSGGESPASGKGRPSGSEGGAEGSATGGAEGTAKAGAGGGAAAGGAAAAAGTVGVAVVAAKQVGDKAKVAAEGVAEQSTGEGGPDGSR